MTLADRLDHVFNRAIDQGKLAAVAACVVRSSEETYARAFSGGDHPSVDVHGVGAIMSMTKAITGTAAMQLVEQGRLSLDAPAGEVCPYLGQVQVYDGSADDGTPILRPPTRPVTLRNLLTHTSGFAYDIWNADLSRLIQDLGVPSIATRQIASIEVPLMFDPGTRWEYGVSIDWVGLMVEAVSGMTLGEYCREHIFAPLGMNATGFEADADMASRRLPMYARANGGLVRLPDGSRTSDGPPPEFELGGGGLLSSAADYAQFLRMLLNRGELNGARVLEPETVALMSQNHMGELRVSELATSMPELSADAELFAGEEKSWGLTFQRHEQSGFTGRPEGTLMWAGLTNCYFWIDPANDIGGVFLTQVLPFADPDCLDVYYDFEQAVYQELVSGSE